MQLTCKQKGRKKMWGAGRRERKKCKWKGREIVKGKRMNECSKPKIKNLSTKRCVRMDTDMQRTKKRRHILNARCALGHKLTVKWRDDKKKKTDAKSKKGSHEVKKKLALYKFSTLILGLLISGGILNPKGPLLKPFSYTCLSSW